MTFASGVAPDEDDLARVRAQEQVFERARVHLPRDPFPHYLAHLRVENLRPQAAEALVQDIVFIHGSQLARGADRSPEPELVIANWQSSRFSELLFGVRAEGKSLEDIATPLSAEQADRIHTRAERERQGLRRFRPGPGTGQAFSSPGMLGTAGGERMSAAEADAALDREVELIAAVVAVEGPIGREQLALAVQGRSWGPGRFRGALRESLREGRTREMAHNAYGPPGG